MTIRPHSELKPIIEEFARAESEALAHYLVYAMEFNGSLAEHKDAILQELKKHSRIIRKNKMFMRDMRKAKRLKELADKPRMTRTERAEWNRIVKSLEPKGRKKSKGKKDA